MKEKNHDPKGFHAQIHYEPLNQDYKGNPYLSLNPTQLNT